MSIDNIFEEIRKLIFRLVKQGYDSKQIGKAVGDYLEKNGLKREFAKQLQGAAAADWVNARTLAPEIRESTIDAFLKIKSDFGKVDGRLKESIVKTVREGLKANKTIKELTGDLHNDLNKNKNWADAVAHTAKMVVSRTRAVNQAIESGVKKLKYAGPGAQRDFCKEHLGKEYTIAEIEEMDNGQGLPVLYYMGGYRCVHRWVPVVE